MKKKLITLAVVVVALIALYVHNELRWPERWDSREGSVRIAREYPDSVTIRNLFEEPVSGTYVIDGDTITISCTYMGTPYEITGNRKTIVAEGVTLTAAPSAVDQIIGWIPALLQASWVTLSLTALSVSLALILSIFLALGKISKNPVISGFCGGYIFFFRATPLMMQLFFIYFALPNIHTALIIPDRFTAAVIAFTLNIAAYCAEIIRAAIQSIDKGQMEASKAMGLSYAQAMRLVIIPQAYRRMIPPICNEFILVLKDTSLVFVIGLMDLTSQTRKIQSSNATALVFIPAMAIYLVMTYVFTTVFNRLEKKLSEYE
jgi:polar amino acid transport system permease protein